MPYHFDLTEKENLEDQVASILGEGFYDTWTIEELRAVVARHNQPTRSPAPVPTRSRVDKLTWSEPEYHVKDGLLWARKTAQNSEGRVFVQDMRAPQRIAWQGRIVSAAALTRYLSTGSWDRPVRAYRAVVWDGLKTRHLGYFTTPEERDAAVLTWKLNRPLC